MVSLEITSRSMYLHLFIPQLFIKHSLYPKLCPQPWRPTNKEDKVSALGSSQNSFQTPLTAELYEQGVRAQDIS